MRIFIVLLLSCIPLIGADTDIQFTTTSQTNVEKNLVFTQEVFTRTGQTNLVRRTMYKAGKLETRLQQIYHDGRLLALINNGPDIFYIKTMAGSPYSVSFDYWPSNNLKSVGIWTSNDTLVDFFNFKDGILSPELSSVLQGYAAAKNLDKWSNNTLEPTATAP